MKSQTNLHLRARCSLHIVDSTDDGARAGRRVLIVEYQDEAFAKLKADLEKVGAIVDRATLGANVAVSARRFLLDLILISDQIPDESCYLIAAKLPFGGCSAPRWIYATRNTTRYRNCLAGIGIDRVFECGNDAGQTLDCVSKEVCQFFADECQFNISKNKETIACYSKTSVAC